MRRIQSVLVLCVAFLSVLGPQRSSAGPYTTPEVLPVHSWSGFYLGANLGGAWGSTTAFYNGSNAAGDLLERGSERLHRRFAARLQLAARPAALRSRG
jgi:hypothetical protein